ncbi:hypothetical protein D9M72_537370 [compost metagenome]
MVGVLHPHFRRERVRRPHHSVELDTARPRSGSGQEVVERAELRIRAIPLVPGDPIYGAEYVSAQSRIRLGRRVEPTQPLFEIRLEFGEPFRICKRTDHAVRIRFRDF